MGTNMDDLTQPDTTQSPDRKFAHTANRIVVAGVNREIESMPKMKTDQPTICEMRERLEKAKEWHQPCYEDWLSRNSWILELASAELARREEMEDSNG